MDGGIRVCAEGISSWECGVRKSTEGERRPPFLKDIKEISMCEKEFVEEPHGRRNAQAAPDCLDP